MTGTMEQRPFGRTGETVSLIGLGGAALHKHSYQHGLATVKHALDLGISYFDTSPGYGIGGPEGKWISRGSRSALWVRGSRGRASRTCWPRRSMPGRLPIIRAKVSSTERSSRMCASSSWPGKSGDSYRYLIRNRSLI